MNKLAGELQKRQSLEFVPVIGICTSALEHGNCCNFRLLRVLEGQTIEPSRDGGSCSAVTGLTFPRQCNDGVTASSADPRGR